MCNGFHSRMYSQIGLRSGNEGGKLAIILTANLLDGNNSCRLLVDDRSKASLSLNDDVRDTHFSTESRKENDEFNGVNVMRDNNECCLLGLDQSNDVVEAIFHIDGFFCALEGGPVNPIVKSVASTHPHLLGITTTSSGRRHRGKMSILFLFCLGTVLVK